MRIESSVKPMDASKLSTISKANTDEKVGEFWDTHNFTDFDSDVPDVEFEVVCTVPIAADPFGEIERQASQRGVQVEALVNLWLRQKLAEQAAV